MIKISYAAATVTLHEGHDEKVALDDAARALQKIAVACGRVDVAAELGEVRSLIRDPGNQDLKVAPAPSLHPRLEEVLAQLHQAAVKDEEVGFPTVGHLTRGVETIVTLKIAEQLIRDADAVYWDPERYHPGYDLLLVNEHQDPAGTWLKVSAPEDWRRGFAEATSR